jgi:hypothetical protein
LEAERQYLKEMGRWLSALRSILGHPFLLLLVGALLTSILVPSCTRNWQQYEKELEIKRELVQDISRSTGTFQQALKTVQVTSLPVGKSGGEYAGRLVDRWEVEGQVLASEIQLYFPNTGLSERWLRFASAAREAYGLFAVGYDRFGREKALAKIERELRLPKSVRGELSILARTPRQLTLMAGEGLLPGELSLLAGGADRTIEGRFIEASYRLLDLIEEERASILQALLESPSAL